MKKTSLIVVALLLVVVATIPIIGNKFMQKYTKDTIVVLKSHGLKLLTLKTDDSYLNTKKQFKFVVEDSSEFVKYLNERSHGKLPLETKSDLDGTVLGLDLIYSNIPFAKSIKFALYPLELSKVVSEKIKEEDVNFYDKFSAFLKNKGLFYYGEYNLINQKFTTHMKSIHQHYALHNSSDVNVTLSGVSFNGQGDIFSPEKLVTSIKTMNFKASQKEVFAKLILDNFYAKNKFISLSNNENSVSFSKLAFIVKGKKSNINITLNGLKTASNATLNKNLIAMNSNTTLKKIVLLLKNIDLKATNFHAKTSVTNIALKPFKSLQTIVSKLSNTNMSRREQRKLRESVLALFADGMKIKIDDISLKNITLKDKNNIGAFKIGADIQIKKDANLAKKLQQSPLLLLGNLDVDSNLTLSKKLYNLLIQNTPMAQMISSYAKKEQNNIIFNLSFHNSKLQINGKQIK